MQVSSDLKLCGCKGIRTCLLCENNKHVSNSPVELKRKFFYCTKCKTAFAQRHLSESDHSENDAEVMLVKGILVIEDFLSGNEEIELLQGIDNTPWIASQSGRHKQDFGPKVNFKKQKIKTSAFKGFPLFTQPLIAKIQDSVSLLGDFFPVELCNLEYVPERGAAIDPHLDDAWLWGERLVTVNLLSDTYLTLTPCDKEMSGTEVIVPMPQKSLIVIYSDARHLWYHAIAREHITQRRIAMTFRELSEPFMGNGPYHQTGKVLLEIANNFF